MTKNEDPNPVKVEVRKGFEGKPELHVIDAKHDPPHFRYQIEHWYGNCLVIHGEHYGVTRRTTHHTIEPVPLKELHAFLTDLMKEGYHKK